METQTITAQLKTDYSDFTQFMQGLNEEQILMAFPEKWSNGQILSHMYMSIRPLEKLLRDKAQFFQAGMGKTDQGSRPYDTIVRIYQAELAKGGKAPKAFGPDPVPFEQVPVLVEKLNKSMNTLTQALESYTEEELDTYCIPHPLIGHMTIREFMMFSIYHLGHHRKQIDARLT